MSTWNLNIGGAPGTEDQAFAAPPAGASWTASDWVLLGSALPFTSWIPSAPPPQSSNMLLMGVG